MKALKIIFNILGVLLALVLSLLLFVGLVTLPVISAVSSATQADTIQEVVENVDYASLISADAEMEKALAESGISGETISDLMATETLGEMIDLYIEDLFAAIEDTGAEPKLTVDSFKGIVDKNIEELVPIAEGLLKASVPEGDVLEKEQLVQMTKEMMYESAESIIGALPSAEDLGLVVPAAETAPENEELALAIKYLHDGTVVAGWIVLVAVLSVLILLCRCMRFKGFMWLGVVYALAAAVSALIAQVVKKPQILPGIPAEEIEPLEPVFAILAGELGRVTMKLAILAVIFIVIFAAGRAVLRRKTQ